MNVIAEIQRINERELELGVGFEGSWHQKYKDSAWVYVGGLAFELTEGDVLCVLSQFGEIEDINLVRDGKTGKSKGFAFIKYENWLSTVLAVDNLNGARLLERVIRVDHVLKYKLPKEIRDREDEREARLLAGEGSDSERSGDNDDGEKEKKKKRKKEKKKAESNGSRPRGLPGHAYEGKELEGSLDITRGHNVFAAPKETKEEKKKRKKEAKKKHKKAKSLQELEEKQAQWMQEVQRKRQAQREEEERQRLLLQNEDDPTAPQPSETGWRGRMEPTAPQPRRPGKSARGQDEEEDSEAAYKERERKRRAGYGGINRVR